MSAPEGSLRVKAAGWLAWASVVRIGREVINVGGRLVLARLLWPEAFGLFALAYAAVAGVRLCCQLQIDVSIIQRRDLDDDLLSTAQWSLAVLGGAGMLLVAGLAGPLGAALGHAEIAPLLRLLSLLIVLDAFAVVPRAWLVRRLSFRPLAGVGLAAEGSGTGAAIAAAAFGAGAASLVVHAVATSLVEVVLLWMVVPWRPTRHWQACELSGLCRFGWPILGRRGIDYLILQGDRFLIGYAFGPAALGLYAVALRLVKGVVDRIDWIFDRVAFPAFSHMRDEIQRTRRGFREAFRLHAVLVLPAAAALGLLARDLVPVVLGDRWSGAAPLMMIVAVRAVMASFGVLPRAALLAAGRPRVILAVSACALAASVLGWAAGFPWGTPGVAAGGAAAAALIGPLTAWLARGETGMTAGAWLRALLPAAGAAALVASAIQITRALVPEAVLPIGPARLALLAAVAGLSYALPLIPWIRRERRRFLDAARLPRPA
jgi:PST family polysaccharide transporter